MSEDAVMNKERLRLLFSLRHLPKEYDDIDRISKYFGVAGVIISGILFHRHPLAFVGVSLGIFYCGRFMAIVLHGRRNSPSQENALQTVRTAGIFALTIVVAVSLIAVMYWFWATRQSIFAVESILGATTLIWLLGVGRARFVLGLVDIALVITALSLSFLFQSIGFLAAGAYAAFIAWALFFGKREQESGSPLRSSSLEKE
jgi:hypothetical protein